MKPTIRQRIAEYLTEHRTAKMRELAEALKVSPHSMSGSISSMLDVGILRAIPGSLKRNQQYQLSTPADKAPNRRKQNGVEPVAKPEVKNITPRSYRAQIAFDAMQQTNPASFRPVPAPEFVNRGKRTKPGRVC